MKVALCGGAGFVGESVARVLREKKHDVTVFDLRPPRDGGDFVRLDLRRDLPDTRVFKGYDAIINLAGMPVSRRWNDRTKREIRESRVLTTKRIVSCFSQMDERPKVLVTASGTDYYGPNPGGPCDESAPPGNDFLAQVTIEWENEARRAERFGIRTVQVRMASIVGPGALVAGFVPMFNITGGIYFGSGTQWMPWIDREDVARVYAFVLENENIRGPVNASVPEVPAQRDFMASIAGAVGMFMWPVGAPKALVRFFMGEGAEMIYGSQKVVPKKLLDAKFSFEETDHKIAVAEAVAELDKLAAARHAAKKPPVEKK